MPLRLSAVLLTCTTWLAAGEAPGWPQLTGDGIYGATGADTPIGPQGRRVWLNPTYMGHQKSNDAKAEGVFFGGVAGLVVADGRVFGNYYRPSGEVLNTVTANRYNPLDKQPRSVRLVDADDVTVAMDAATGKTLWTAVEAGTAINGLTAKRFHFGISPAVADGRVFVFGALGIVFAYDAATGKKLWQTPVEPWHGLATAVKERCLRTSAVLDVYAGVEPFKDQASGLVVAGGMLVAPDGAGGLVGIDPASGAQRWAAKGVSNLACTPTTWTHQGTQYLLTGGSGRNNHLIKLIDPRTGAVLWSLDPGGPNRMSPIHDGSILLANTTGTIDRATAKTSADPTQATRGLMGGFRLALTVPERLWVMKELSEHRFELMPDIGRTRRFVARDGWAYGLVGPVADKGIHLAAIDLSTGAVTARIPCDNPFSGLPVLAGNRLAVHRNVGHSWDPAGYDICDVSTPGTPRPLGALLLMPLGVAQTTSYETSPEFPIVAGRLYCKTKDGVACVEMR